MRPNTNLVSASVDWRTGHEVSLYELDFPSLVAARLALADRGCPNRP
jgi:hypothetical protein